jgi:hypothetical protein
MNGSQQAQLEAMAGRSMTPEEVIMATARQDKDLADSLSVGRTQLVETVKSERRIMAELGPIAGAAFMDAMDSFILDGKSAAPTPIQPYFSAIKRSVVWLYGDGLDFANLGMRAVLDAMAAFGILDAGSVAIVKASALQPDPLSVDTISEVLNS